MIVLMKNRSQVSKRKIGIEFFHQYINFKIFFMQTITKIISFQIDDKKPDKWSYIMQQQNIYEAMLRLISTQTLW